MGSGIGVSIRVLKNLLGRLPRDRIRSGTNRFVVLNPHRGIAIKFPLPVVFPKSQEGANKRSVPLVKGIAANEGEFLFWRGMAHPICMPTLACYGRGLVSIQRLGTPLELDYFDFTHQINNLGGLDVRADTHHFLNMSNFCSDNKGRLVMVDYGERITQAVILLKGDQIQQKFDFSYCFLRTRGFSEKHIRAYYESRKKPKGRQK